MTVKVTCEHDEQGYHGDQTLDDVKHTAIQLMYPNFHTIENGVQLKKIEVQFNNEDNFTVDDYNFSGNVNDETLTERSYR